MKALRGQFSKIPLEKLYQKYVPKNFCLINSRSKLKSFETVVHNKDLVKVYVS